MFIWHIHEYLPQCKIARIWVFSGTYFSVLGQYLQFSPSSGKYKPEKTCILAYFMQRAHKSLHVNLETLQSKKIWHFLTMLNLLVLLCFKVFILPKTKHLKRENTFRKKTNILDYFMHCVHKSLHVWKLWNPGKSK